MLKRIKVADARTGMFVRKLEGSWLDHSLWRSRHLLVNETEVEKLRRSAVGHIWIDTAKGVDVAAEQTASDADREIPGGDHVAYAPGTPSIVFTSPALSLTQEIQNAATVVKRGRQAVQRMFEDARLGKAIDAEGLLPLVQDICESLDRNPAAVISLARLKTADDYTYMHSVAVCALMIALARQLGLDEAQSRDAGIAGLLHDVGKAAMPIEVLDKPGKLTPVEYGIIKTHPVKGHQMLLETHGASSAALDVCLHHHERPDGRGYPEGLSGNEVSLMARMGAVCDVYDAITSNRPYKTGWDPASSLAQMASWTGQFDEKVLHAFIRTLGIYPTGSLVRLKSGKLAIVLEQSAGSALTPIVRAFFSTKANQHITPERVDLSRSADAIVSREDPDAWEFRQLDELWLEGNVLRGSR